MKEESNLTVTCKLLDGPPAQTLADHVRENGIDLVIMTTHGRGGLSRFWLGSVADRLVHHLAIPVLVIRPSESARRIAGISRILVPLDGSALAESILDPLRTLAGVTGAELVLAAAVEPVPTLLPTFPYPVEVEPGNMDERESRGPPVSGRGAGPDREPGNRGAPTGRAGGAAQRDHPAGGRGRL